MSVYAGKTILVTGAAGFIGSHLVDALLKDGARRVIGLDSLIAGSKANLAEANQNSAFEFVQGDVRDAGLIHQIVADVDYVFHLAASKLVVSRNNPLIDLETNIFGTFNILAAARGRNVRVVYASTGSTLGSSDRPMEETHVKRPTTLYGISKGTAEEYCQFFCREFGVKATIIRYFHVYGPRQDYDGAAGVINIFLSRALRGRDLYVHGSGEQIRCFTYVLDDVAATMFLGSRPDTAGEIYHIASSVRMKVVDLAETILKRYGVRGVKVVHDEERPGENLRPEPTTAKIEALGFKAHTDFETGLAVTKEWIESDLKHRGLL
jgi:UDP-glucose 4-epimerase